MIKSKSLDFFNAKSPAETDKFVSKNIEIINRVYEILEIKAWTLKDLSRRMGKPETEINKWLTGLHNFSLKNIIKLEIALESEIITVPDCQKKHKSTRNQVASLPNSY
jgi:hypothetical protein